MTIQRLELKVTTTGSAGAATGTADSPHIRGRIIAVHVNYHASAPATTDVTLAMLGTPNENIVNRPNSATDAWIYPTRAMTDEAGANRLYAAAGQVVPTQFVAHDQLRLSVEGSDALTDAVIATVFYEDGVNQ